MTVQAELARQWATEIAARAAGRAVRQLAKTPVMLSGESGNARVARYLARAQGEG